jgi:hypothetical protein
VRYIGIVLCAVAPGITKDCVTQKDTSFVDISVSAHADAECGVVTVVSS